ncbi:putative lipid II flippase FtsW [Anaerovorax odorimutans]|uniref:putative lipid II flippase FtsW n=1 Tax=Anaerovorax odorimutans TaxID=109327 RepID=UPI00041E44A0|nr:putative lipid II flippase FtsW [Anaerovorax odorimutans]
MAGKKRTRMKSGDFILTILTLGLVVFGIIMVFSASYYNAINASGDPYYYLKRDVLWACIGLILMISTALVDYKVYARFAPAIISISFLLLFLLFTPIGLTRNNATRWIGVGEMTIMPGEIAKIAVIIFVSWYLSQDPSRIKSLTRGVIPLLFLAGMMFALIYKQPNLSTAITVVGIVVGIMFVAGLSLFYFVGIVGLGAMGIFGLIMTGGGEKLKRFMSFLDPFKDELGDGYQVVQSLLALGSGGIFGVGLGKSIQKTLYLPEPQNDFIFAIIGEELGFVGCLILIACYLLLIWRGIHIAMNAPDMFGCFMASGITIMLALQVILNIAVVTSSMPPTGITLPFVSYGGNALMLFMGAMGILLNISRHSAK